MELAWSDLASRKVPYRTLRLECPCASCRNEWTGERIIEPEKIREDLKLDAMEPVGNYAVRFAWNDGHSSGLFTWEALRAIFERDLHERPSTQVSS
jgi:DUF971 family protein